MIYFNTNDVAANVACVPACHHVMTHKGTTWRTCGPRMAPLEGHISLISFFIIYLILNAVSIHIPPKMHSIFHLLII